MSYSLRSFALWVPVVAAIISKPYYYNAIKELQGVQ